MAINNSITFSQSFNNLALNHYMQMRLGTKSTERKPKQQNIHPTTIAKWHSASCDTDQVPNHA